MSRLIRFFSRLPLNMERMVRTWKREMREVSYDLSRMKKNTLRRTYMVITVFATAVPPTLYIMANTYYKEYLQDRVALKVGNIPMPLNHDLELMALREWNFSHIAREAKLMGLMEFFVCKGSQPFAIGDLESRTGAIIGLPHNFSYKTIDDVNLKELKIVGENIGKFVSESKSKALKQLTEALVLSDNAKKFAIVREIHLTNNMKNLQEFLNLMIACFVGVGGSCQLILVRNIRRRYLFSFLIRVCFLGLGVCLWFLGRQYINYSLNVDADKNAVNQGPDYYAGALEYYEKQLKKNAALFVLLGPKGHKKFTADGEEKGLFSTVPSFKKRLEKIKLLEYSEEELSEEQTDSQSDKQNDVKTEDKK